ncbi:MAG: N-acetyltransferase [Actinomycetota bacterium]|nr:N-acetyltransferase [Actinomycetota bacterium]
MTSPPTVLLRRDTPADASEVASIVGQAFGADEPEVPLLVEALRPFSVFGSRLGDDGGPAAPLALVAEVAGELVGHVMLSKGHIDAWQRMVPTLVLSPLAVLPDHQRTGVGTALIAGALELGRAVGSPAVFLEGSPTYYSRRGFLPATPLGFRRPSLRVPLPAFQVVLLPAHEQWMTGTLVYPAPFWEFDSVGLRDRALVEKIEGAGPPSARS